MPSEDKFIEGDVVEYRGISGRIVFVSSSYISLCISETVQEELLHKVNQCRLVIYPQHWGEIVEISK